MRFRNLILSVPFLSAVLLAQKPDVTGDWHGTLQAGPQTLRLVLHIQKDGDALRGTLDSVDQGANGIKIDSVVLTGKTLTFEIGALRASYKGTVDASGKHIEGTFHQGVDLELEFSREAAKAPARPQLPKAPFPYRREEVRYAHVPGRPVAESFTTAVEKPAADAVVLAGTLTLPKGKGPFPAAVLISGSGPQDRDESLAGHKPFLVLADYLTRRGIAVLRFDDRGTAASTGNHRTATSRDFADDAEAGLLYLRTRSEIDPQRIGLIGHSEGGLIGPMVAARNKNVGFLVLLAGPGVSGMDVIRLQTRLIARASGAPEAMVEAAAKTNESVFRVAADETLSAAERREKMRSMVADALRKQGQSERVEETAAAQVRRMEGPWMRFFLSYDPAPTLRKVKCPVLALNGVLDLQVDAEQNLPKIAAALREGGNKSVEIVRLNGLNHLFQTAETGSPSEYATIEETFHEPAMARVAEFVLAVGKPGK